MKTSSSVAVSGFTVPGGVAMRTGRFFSAVSLHENGEVFLLSAPWIPLASQVLRRKPFLRSAVFFAEGISHSFSVFKWTSSGEYKYRVFLPLIFQATLFFFIFILMPELIFISVSKIFTFFLNLSPFYRQFVINLLTLSVIISGLVFMRYIPFFKNIFSRHAAEHIVVKAWNESTLFEKRELSSMDFRNPSCGTVHFILFSVLTATLFTITAFFVPEGEMISGSGNYYIYMVFKSLLLLPCLLISIELFRFLKKKKRDSFFGMLSTLTLISPSARDISLAKGTLLQLFHIEKENISLPSVQKFSSIDEFMEKVLTPEILL